MPTRTRETPDDPRLARGPRGGRPRAKLLRGGGVHAGRAQRLPVSLSRRKPLRLFEVVGDLIDGLAVLRERVTRRLGEPVAGGGNGPRRAALRVIFVKHLRIAKRLPESLSGRQSVIGLAELIGLAEHGRFTIADALRYGCLVQPALFV